MAPRVAGVVEAPGGRSDDLVELPGHGEGLGEVLNVAAGDPAAVGRERRLREAEAAAILFVAEAFAAVARQVSA